MKQLSANNPALMGQFKQYVGPLLESFRRKGKAVDPMVLAATLNSLKVLSDDMKGIKESTRSADVGTFIQHGYDLIMAIYPNLVLNLIAGVQPLQYRSGEVYYYDVKYETQKGLVNANTDALSATTGYRVNKHYSSEYIDMLPASGAVDGTNATFGGTFPNAPLRINAGLDFVLVTDGIEIFTVNPSNYSQLQGDKGGTGTLNVTTGAWSVTFNTAPVITAQVIATGKVNFEASPAAIGKTKIVLTPTPIYSQKHQLITEYTLDAEYDIQRNFNMNISDELIKANASLIRAELDQLGMDDILRTARNTSKSAGSIEWDGAVPNGISQLDHFRTLITVFKKQANDIYNSTRMVFGNFIVCGTDIATVIEILPEFKPNPAISSELQQSGPYVTGTIGNFLVIKNPVFDAKEWIVGNRGTSAFNTGYILAPYRGLMVTGPISDVENPFAVTRGLWMDAGRLVVNGKFYHYGTATNLTF